MRLAILPVLVFLLACSGVLDFPPPAPPQPPLPNVERPLPGAPEGEGTPIPGGVVREVRWSAEVGLASKLWVYTPDGDPPETGWPTVLVPPAGSSQLWGMGLAEGDRAEHLPYVEAGYQVVAYEIDGIGEHEDDMAQFGAANSGLDNARHAFRYALDVLPSDPDRVFAAGHSSAGNLTMLFAAHEPRLAGAVVYNSPGDGCWCQADAFLATLALSFPDLPAWCQQGHPASHLHHLEVPLLLFGSREDLVTPADEIEATAAAHPDAPIELRVLDEGDHYTSMIEAELPAAIQWMATQTRGGRGG